MFKPAAFITSLALLVFCFIAAEFFAPYAFILMCATGLQSLD